MGFDLAITLALLAMDEQTPGPAVRDYVACGALAVDGILPMYRRTPSTGGRSRAERPSRSSPSRREHAARRARASNHVRHVRREARRRVPAHLRTDRERGRGGGRGPLELESGDRTADGSPIWNYTNHTVKLEPLSGNKVRITNSLSSYKTDEAEMPIEPIGPVVSRIVEFLGATPGWD